MPLNHEDTQNNVFNSSGLANVIVMFFSCFTSFPVRPRQSVIIQLLIVTQSQKLKDAEFHASRSEYVNRLCLYENGTAAVRVGLNVNHYGISSIWTA